MNTSEVSKRYAKALLAATKQKGIHAKAYTELQAVATGFMKDEDTKNFFQNPTISSDQKVTVVKSALANTQLSEEVLSTILLLASKDRLGVIDEVAQAFQDYVDQEDGITRGTVRSAQPLDEAARKSVEANIMKVLNKKIVLTYSQDPKLLGGIVAQVGGWTFDDSVDTHLKKLNEELNRRAN